MPDISTLPSVGDGYRKAKAHARRRSIKRGDDADAGADAVFLIVVCLLVWLAYTLS